MTTKKALLKKEISAIHWLFLITGKLLVGVGIGIILATHVWFVQPYWYFLLLLGLIVVGLTLYNLERIEVKQETKLKARTEKKKKNTRK